MPLYLRIERVIFKEINWGKGGVLSLQKTLEMRMDKLTTQNSLC